MGECKGSLSKQMCQASPMHQALHWAIHVYYYTCRILVKITSSGVRILGSNPSSVTSCTTSVKLFKMSMVGLPWWSNG